MGIYNKGYTFVREFQTIEEINVFCMRNNCEPLGITPFVVKDNYKAGGSTSAITSIIHEHHYAVILKPFKSEDSSEDGCGSDFDKFDKQTKLKSNRPQAIKASQAEKEFGQTFSVTDILKQEKPVNKDLGSNRPAESSSISRKTLNNVRYTDIADMLHYDDRQKQLSKRWFETHPKDKPFDNYVAYMELQQWQIDILDVLI